LKKWGLIILAAVALGGLIWLGFQLFPSEPKVIQRRLETAARLVSMPSPESSLAQMATANKLAAFFKPEVVINLNGIGFEYNRIQGIDQLRHVILAARSNLQSLNVRVLDMQIDLAPDRQSATVLLTALADVNGEKNMIVQEFQFRLERADRRWWVTQIDTVKALGR
jgi:hypothetical protein